LGQTGHWSYVAEIEKGADNILKVGNTSTKRAITDVRDLIQAMILLAEKGTPGEVYNISGNKVYLVADLIGIIENITGRKFNIEVDKALMRPTDEPIIYGDSSRLMRDTGWKQSFTIEKTLADMVEYWRSVL